MGWNDAKDTIDKVAMRIEHCESCAIFNVLPDEIRQQGRFSCPRGADDVHVLHTLRACEPNRCSLPGMNVLTQEQPCGLLHNCGSGFSGPSIAFKHCRAYWRGGKMDKADKFIAVKKHPGTARLPAQDIVNVFLFGIFVVGKRNELI